MKNNNFATLVYDINDKCNLRCTYCYNSDYFSNNKRESISPLEIAEKINEYTFDRVHIVGGEPLLEKNLFDFIEKLNGVLISINTNGTFIDKKIAEKIIKSVKIDQVTISIDGPNPHINDMTRGDGSFIRAKHGLECLNEIKFRKKSHLIINIASVLTKKNQTRLLELYFLCKKLRIDNLLISQLYINQNNENVDSDIDCDIVTEQLLEIYKNNNIHDTKIIIDINPVYSLLLSTKLKKLFSFSFAGCKYIDGNRYLNPYGQFYPCGPSSKLKMDYNLFERMDELVFSYEAKNKYDCCKLCPFETQCKPCPLNIKTNNFIFCKYAINELNKILNRYKGKELILHSNIKIHDEGEYVIVINFKNGSFARINKTLIVGENTISIPSQLTLKDQVSIEIIDLIIKEII